jgi:hypothetical protein
MLRHTKRGNFSVLLILVAMRQRLLVLKNSAEITHVKPADGLTPPKKAQRRSGSSNRLKRGWPGRSPAMTKSETHPSG